MTKIEKGEDGRKKFTWIVEMSVSETWVEDGFELTNDRELDMLSHDLGYANIGLELDAKVVDAPSRNLIAKAQGYKNAKEMPARD